MHKYLAELPDAPLEMEEDAKTLFPYQKLSAEEYAAREGHRHLCFGFGEYRYADAELNEWIHTLDDIFFTSGELERVQKKILSAEEFEQVQREMKEPF